MPRPKKDNADYFSHDTGMRNHRKVKALRTKFGHEGFSIWVMILEHICSCDHFLAPWNDIEIEILAGDFSATCDRLNEVVSFLLQIGLLQKEGNFLKSQSLIDRMAPMIEKRIRERNKFLPQKLTETTQSKVKESKGKEKEENEDFSKPDDQQLKIEQSQKRQQVNTRGKMWIKIWNDITLRNDVMEDSTFRGLQNFISDLTNEDFSKRVEMYKNCIDLTNTLKLSRFFDIYTGKQIQTFSVTDFIKNINLFGGTKEDVFIKIVNKDYLSKVLRMINPEKPDSSKKEEEIKINPEKQQELKQAQQDFRERFGKK